MMYVYFMIVTGDTHFKETIKLSYLISKIYLQYVQ